MTHNRTLSPRWLDADARNIEFPDVELAMQEPDGLLAVGGALTRDWLLCAYRHGVFPWYGPGQPILWWAPDPRMVLVPGKLHVSHSLGKIIRKRRFEVTLDKTFHAVISACAEHRQGQTGTWITAEMHQAYEQLHHDGYAHSVESWLDGELAGGLYGVAIGRVFFGESMFARHSDASKVAFVSLVRQLHRWGFSLVDCQVYTGHLASLGAAPVSRRAFTGILSQSCQSMDSVQDWRLDDDLTGIPPQESRSP